MKLNSFRPLPLLGGIACICMSRDAVHYGLPAWLGAFMLMLAGALLTRIWDDQ